jgi:hypothetical protein
MGQQVQLDIGLSVIKGSIITSIAGMPVCITNFTGSLVNRKFGYTYQRGELYTVYGVAI